MSASDDPASGIMLITPGPTNILYPTEASMGIRAFVANTAGDITFTSFAGTSATLTILAGYVYPIRLTKVTAFTGTGLYGLY